MICYKAIDRFFDNGEKERESLCGFGYCRVICHAKSGRVKKSRHP